MVSGVFCGGMFVFYFMEEVWFYIVINKGKKKNEKNELKISDNGFFVMVFKVFFNGV